VIEAAALARKYVPTGTREKQPPFKAFEVKAVAKRVERSQGNMVLMEKSNPNLKTATRERTR